MSAPIRVVLVDDQALFRAGIRMVIDSQSDLEVVGEAGDGANGVRVVRETRPDVVLMDIRMPVMDGLTATRRIRASQHPDAARIPILAVTADAFVEDAAKAMAAGMNDHIAKPIDCNQLLKALHTHIAPAEQDTP